MSTFTVGAHGGNWGVYKLSGRNSTWISPHDLAKLIGNNKNWKPGMTIRLHSCNTANPATTPKGEKYSYPLELSRELDNAPVKAPNRTHWTYPDGTFNVAPAAGGKYANGPDLAHPGQWVQFQWPPA